MGRVLVIRTVQALEKNQAVSETGFNCQLTKIKATPFIADTVGTLS